MPRYDVAVRNGYGNNTPVFPNNFSVQEIAQKIIDDKGYYDKLVNGVPQVAIRERENDIKGFHLIIIENTKVFKGVKLGAFYGGYYDNVYRKDEHRDIKSVEATCDGIFVPDIDKLKSNFDGYYYLGYYNLPVEFGKIYLPEFEFFKRNQQKIEQEVKNIPLRKKQEEKQREIQKQQAIELKKQQEEERKRLEAEQKRLEEEERQEAEKRKIEDLLNEQTKYVEKLDDLLKELDKYIQMGQEISIETLQNIKDKLKFLYSQKDNLKDKKTISDLKSHFETSYKVAKSNPKFTEIIEDRMIVILKTFFEILGESEDSINTKISEIRSAGNDKKFAVEFNEKINTLNESVTRLQSSFTNEKKIDFTQLEIIEKISVDFEKQKKRINQKKLIERSKDSIGSIWKEYSKMEEKSSSAENTLKRILKNLYEVFGKSEQEIKEIFSTYEKEQEFANRISEKNATIKSLSEKIRELEILIENNESVKIELLQTLEEMIKGLVKQKDIIQDKTEIENIKVHFDAIFKDFKKRKDFSNSATLRMKEIEKGFEEICGKQEKKGFFSKIFSR